MKVSIITPSYNRLDFLDKMIESVYAEGIDTSGFELIITDDESTDGTKEYLEQISAKYGNIKTLISQKKSIGYARNMAIEAASGEWILLLDTDNVMTENGMSKVLSYINKYDKSPFIGLWFKCVTHSGKNLTQFDSSKETILLDIDTYISSFSGEVVHLLRANWFKQHLYPYFEGTKTEFAEALWLPLAIEKKILLVNDFIQYYDNVSEGRASTAKYHQSRIYESFLYQYLTLGSLKEIGKFKKFVFRSAIKFVVFYKAYDKPEDIKKYFQEGLNNISNPFIKSTAVLLSMLPKMVFSHFKK